MRKLYLRVFAWLALCTIGWVACADFNAPERGLILVCFVNDSTEVDLSDLDSLVVDGCKVPEDDDHHDHGHDH